MSNTRPRIPEAFSNQKANPFMGAVVAAVDQSTVNVAVQAPFQVSIAHRRAYGGFRGARSGQAMR